MTATCGPHADPMQPCDCAFANSFGVLEQVHLDFIMYGNTRLTQIGNTVFPNLKLVGKYSLT